MAEKGSGGGARRGQQVLERLREQPPALWYRGELVKDVTAHPALRGGVQTLAHLYDLQWEKPEVTLYDSPTSGHKVARSFMMPKTHEELASISRAMRVWEDYTRTPALERTPFATMNTCGKTIFA
jgi:4-hydroxyphenylacetate 3-monooxygenase